MRCEETQELITGLIDGELSPQESSLIATHLANCSKCRWIRSEEAALKKTLRDASTMIRAPVALRWKILSDRRIFMDKPVYSEIRQRLSSFLRSLPGPAAAIAMLALAVLPLYYWSRSQSLPIAPGIFQSYAQVVNGDIEPIQTASMTDLKARLVRSVEGKFSPMAYDFSEMELWLIGGLYQEIGNRKVLVTVYKGAGPYVVCYTFLGSEADAPAIANVFFDPDKTMNFYQFFQGRANAVMHREGQVLCILVSQMPMPELLALARAKAHAS